MRWKPRLGALLFIAAIPIAASELLGPAWSITTVLMGIGAGWLLVQGFWRSSLSGAIGGVVAGLLVLGPGLRMAMRVVAILDPVRSPEFTVEGTLFIFIVVGGMMGGIFGLVGNIARGGFGIPSGAAGLVPALLVMSMIGLDSELRKEIVELGAGAWLNIPMFGAVAAGYGTLWIRVVNRLEMGRVEKKARRETAESATMTLSNPRGLET
jgi:hypothetical protein